MANYVSDSTKADPSFDRKKQITPKHIYDVLSNSVKADLLGRLIISGAFLVIMLMFILLVNLLDESEITKTAAFLIKLVLWSIPFLAALWSLYRYYRDMKILGRGEYRVITDTVSRVVTDDRYVRRGRHSYMEHAMYLYRCGRVVISLEETYTNSEGDEFYVVVANSRSNKALLAYNKNYYELADITVQ